MKAIKLTSFAGALLILAGCGGGGGGSATGGTALSSATFVDSPVQGLHYAASPSGTTGTTDENGTFNFADGDTVSFKIGGSNGLEIASSKPAASTPIFVADLPGGAQIAQVLQSFDTGGNSSTKLDLSKIQTIPATTKTALENHIKARGDLTAGAAVINTALTDIWTATENSSSLSGVTKPAAKTEAEVQSHLNASVAKLPKKLPKIAGSSYVAIDESNKLLLSLSAFTEDGKYTGLSDSLNALSGTYSVSTDSVTLNITDWRSLTGTETGKADCKVVSTLNENIVGGFQVTSVQSGNDCESKTTNEKIYTLDKGFSKDWLKGKTITAEALSDYPDPCLPATWVVNDAGTSVEVTNASSVNCTTTSFTAELNAPFAADGFPYVLTVSGTSGNYKILYVLTKLAGFSDRYASMIYVKSSGSSSYTYNAGRLVKASVK